MTRKLRTQSHLDSGTNARTESISSNGCRNLSLIVATVAATLLWASCSNTPAHQSSGFHAAQAAVSYDSLARSFAPAAWWALSDSPGSVTAADSSDHGHRGSTFGGVGFGYQGPFPAQSEDAAAFFNGSTSGIETNYRPGFSELSVACWFNAESTADGALVVTDKSYSTKRGFQFVLGGPGSVYFIIGTGRNWKEVSSGAPQGFWAQAIATYNGATLRLYVDGLEEASARLSGSMPAGQRGVAIGYDPTGTYHEFYGELAQVQIFNYALTATQVWSLYAAAQKV